VSSLLALLLVALVSLIAGLILQFAIGPSGDAPVSNPQAAPFLGGGNMKTHAWQRFHVRYYPMVLLFIAFEMEMMFMYPWAVVFVEEGAKALMEMGMFLTILSVGIVYAWREGVFRWQ
jgi:NADH:ubiquinone oxidoreductase subunit 3 (subunit A)